MILTQDPFTHETVDAAFITFADDIARLLIHNTTPERVYQLGLIDYIQDGVTKKEVTTRFFGKGAQDKMRRHYSDEKKKAGLPWEACSLSAINGGYHSC